jgi:glutamine kinase
MSKSQFSSKASTLAKLRPLIGKSVIGSIYIFSAKDWQGKEKKKIKENVANFFSKQIIVRSSAEHEDNSETSNAGHFVSVSNINPLVGKQLENAVDKVIQSYGRICKKDKVLIQNYYTNIELSGVIFTRDINTLSPYITINYDDYSGLSNTVTSGSHHKTKTLVVFKKSDYKKLPKPFAQICKSVLEIEKILNFDALDIEFFIKNDNVHIVQVRPLVKAINKKDLATTKEIANTLDQIKSKINELRSPHPDLYGNDTAYGVMPDWNPAEIIGINPRPLALSLYRELVTDNIWAYQRDNYGYKRLRSFPLMVSFAGYPYIDLRVDFSSYIPKTLNDDLSHKLVNYYLHKIKKQPSSHDKIEFDIVLSCYVFDLGKKLKELQNSSFSISQTNRIKESLHKLTKTIIGSENKKGLCKKDIEKVEILQKRSKILLKSSQSHINKIYWLLEDCKRYGTLPFAGVARSAFIAAQFLNSLVDLKIITPEEKAAFLNSLNTVAKQISQDVILLKSQKLSKYKFLKKYGHLRPGTYDILTESYQENFSKYFSIKNKKSKLNAPPKHNKFSFSNKQVSEIQKLLDKHKLPFSAKHFINFLKESIEGREYCKFVFSKNISQALTLIKEYGKDLGFSIDDSSFIEISTIMKLYSTVVYYDERELLDKEIKRNRKVYKYFKNIKMPHLIIHPQDLYVFHLDSIQPNYITTNKTEGEPIFINSRSEIKNIKQKIVFIESADPGYDWIFSQQIKGLVTMYGGANSHMAIRCAELNIPGVIGCGQTYFNKWSRSQQLLIDCSNNKISQILV